MHLMQNDLQLRRVAMSATPVFEIQLFLMEVVFLELCYEN